MKNIYETRITTNQLYSICLYFMHRVEAFRLGHSNPLALAGVTCDQTEWLHGKATLNEIPKELLWGFILSTFKGPIWGMTSEGRFERDPDVIKDLFDQHGPSKSLMIKEAASSGTDWILEGENLHFGLSLKHFELLKKAFPSVQWQVAAKVYESYGQLTPELVDLWASEVSQVSLPAVTEGMISAPYDWLILISGGSEVLHYCPVSSALSLNISESEKGELEASLGLTLLKPAGVEPLAHIPERFTVNLFESFCFQPLNIDLETLI